MNREIILASRPAGMVNSSNFKINEKEIPKIKDKEILIQTRFLTVDPYMRGRMNEQPSYIEPFQINQPITGEIVGEIIESKNSDYRTGEFVSGFFPWADYNVSNGRDLRRLNPTLAPVSTALGVLGMPGMTAYFGFLDIGKPKPGETVVISGAAGAVGMLVGQIAKIKGCKVIGIAGSEEKIKYLVDDLHFEHALNYKKNTFSHDLKKACTNGIDIYFDNVGGTITDTVLTLINDHSRIVICGQISMYNSIKADEGPRNWWLLLTKRALAQGFIVTDFEGRYSEGMQQMAQWIKEGKIKYRESIINGLENAPEAFLGLFRGDNIGKQIVKVS